MRAAQVYDALLEERAACLSYLRRMGELQLTISGRQRVAQVREEALWLNERMDEVDLATVPW